MASATLTNPKPAPAKRARRAAPAAKEAPAVSAREEWESAEAARQEAAETVVDTTSGLAELLAPKALPAYGDLESTKPAPLTKPLWRYRDHAERRALLERFVGLQVMIETWPGRIGAKGDNQYRGTLIAVALSTTGTTADFAILTTVDGTCWALSTAQIHFVEAR